jgi:hypothetical protein
VGDFEVAISGGFWVAIRVFCPGNVITPIFGEGVTPPPDAITVDEAVEYIFQELEKKSLVIVFPEVVRHLDKLYRENRVEYDKFACQMSAERRENYRTKGTYY